MSALRGLARKINNLLSCFPRASRHTQSNKQATSKQRLPPSSSSSLPASPTLHSQLAPHGRRVPRISSSGSPPPPSPKPAPLPHPSLLLLLQYVPTLAFFTTPTYNPRTPQHTGTTPLLIALCSRRRGAGGDVQRPRRPRKGEGPPIGLTVRERRMTTTRRRRRRSKAVVRPGVDRDLRREEGETMAW